MIIKYIVPFLCLAFGSISACSQNLDSLKALLAAAEGKERVDVLYELSHDHMGINNNTALAYGVEGYTLASSLNDSLRILKTGMVTASALRRLGEIDSALAVSNRVLPISGRNGYRGMRAILLNSMGILHNYKAQYDKALQYYFESLSIRRSMADTASQLVVMRNVALVYYKLKNYRKALNMFIDNVRMHEKLGYFDDHDILLLNIAHCHAYLNEFDSAKFYIRKALRFCGSGCSDDRFVQANFVEGITLFGQNDWKRAEPYFLKSFHLARSLEDVRLQLDNIDYLSQIYLHLGRYSDVSRYLDMGESLISQNHSFNLERIKIYSRFSELYSKTRDYEKASHFQWMHSRLKDTVFNGEMTRNLMKAEADFLERENAAKITAQNEVIGLKEEIIRHERVKNRILILLAAVFAGFIGLLFRNYRQKKNLNTRLERKIAERTQELRHSRDELLTTLQERDVMFHRASQSVHETMKTIRGLCFAGMKEITDPLAVAYIRKIDSSSGQLSNQFRAHFQGILVG